MIGHQIFKALQNFLGQLKPNFMLEETKICWVDLGNPHIGADKEIFWA